MIAFLLTTLALAATGPAELIEAADDTLPEAQRMEAFERMVSDYLWMKDSLQSIASSDSADARQRWVAIRVIGQVPSDESLDILIKLSADPMPAIRVAAVSALGDVGSASALGKVATLLEDPAMIVRGAAADALAVIGDAAALPDLERALADPTNYYRGSSLWVRKHYVRAMGQIGSRDALPTLIGCFDDRDPEIVLAALDALRSLVGYDFAEGRTQAEHIEEWRSWYANGGH